MVRLVVPGAGRSGGRGQGVLPAVPACLRAAAEVAGLSHVGPQACDVPTLVRVAGSRWRIESAFEMAEQEVALLSVARTASRHPKKPAG